MPDVSDQRPMTEVVDILRGAWGIPGSRYRICRSHMLGGWVVRTITPIGGATKDDLRAFETWAEALAAVGIRDVPPYSREVAG